MMFAKLPVSIAVSASPGFPSLRTKHKRKSFVINAGANKRTTIRYVFVISKISPSAPRRDVIFPEKPSPIRTKIKAKIPTRYAVFVKILLPSCSIFCPRKIEYFVAPPIPSIIPQPCTKLYTGIAIFRAARPSEPSPLAIKKVSARI